MTLGPLHAGPGPQRRPFQSCPVAVGGALTWESGAGQARGPSDPERPPTQRGCHPTQPLGPAAEARAGDWEQGCLRAPGGRLPTPPAPPALVWDTFPQSSRRQGQTLERPLLKWPQTRKRETHLTALRGGMAAQEATATCLYALRSAAAEKTRL